MKSISRAQIAEVLRTIDSMNLAVNSHWVTLFSTFYGMTMFVDFATAQAHECLGKVMDEIENGLDSCEVVNFMGCWNIYIDLTDGSTVHMCLDETDYWQNQIETTNEKLVELIAGFEIRQPQRADRGGARSKERIG